jgi:hypothetical protein
MRRYKGDDIEVQKKEGEVEATKVDRSHDDEWSGREKMVRKREDASGV